MKSITFEVLIPTAQMDPQRLVKKYKSLYEHILTPIHWRIYDRVRDPIRLQLLRDTFRMDMGAK